MTTATTTDRAAEVHAGLLAGGFEPGRPATLSASDYRTDVETWAQCPCPQCRAEGLEFLAYRKGNAYAGLARCRRCGFGEEA